MAALRSIGCGFTSRLDYNGPVMLNPGYKAAVNDAKARVREITVAEYKALAESGTAHVLVDVREDNEFAAGHAIGSTHLGKGIIERDIETLLPDKAAKLVLYCGGGYRSALAGDSIQKMGYGDVWSLAGGWKDWLAAGLPVEK